MWVETRALAPGQRIETADDRGLTITDIAITDRVERTYTLTVSGPHTFLVGEDGAVVHNVCRELLELAENLGFRLDRSVGRFQGQDVFRSGRRYISRDIDSHSGGYWKVFERRGGQLRRVGTYNRDLTTRIGD